MSKSSPLKYLSSESGNISSLLEKARKLAHLTEKLKPFLPVAARDEVQACDLSEGKLVLSCFNTAIAARLRILSAELTTRLRSEGVFIDTVDVIIIAPPSRRTR